MTIKSLKNLYTDSLSAIYPPSEIMSIFALLAQYRLGFDRATLILEGDQELSPPDLDYFKNSLKRLQKNEPVQYILGETSFYDLTFKVNSNVLIPRPETEELVSWIIEDIQEQNSKKSIRILDIGTGSGCIAISLAKNITNAEVWAIDVSKKALDIAKENAEYNRVQIHFILLDILQAERLPESFDIIVSNPPYVRIQEKERLHDNILAFEPEQALYVHDANPLIFYDKIACLATDFLDKRGHLYFEINQYLGAETLQLVQKKGFKNCELRKDVLRNDRMLRAGM